MFLTDRDFCELLRILEEDKEPISKLVEAFRCYEEMYGAIPPKIEEKLERVTTFRRNKMDIQLVKDAIDAKISQGKMFTAYDITKILRKTFWVKHPTVRDEVHRIFLNGEMDSDYTRTNERVTSNDDYAWIYHHYMDDARDYLNPSVSPANALSPANVTPAVTSPVTSPVAPKATVTDSDTKFTDSRGRLLIEKKHLEAIGLKTGDTANVYDDPINDSLYIAKHNLTQSSLLRQYIVDKDGEIRIGNRVLGHVFSPVPASFDVISNSSCIEIVG